MRQRVEKKVNNRLTRADLSKGISKRYITFL
jgi:hypothetical protein